MCIDSINYKVYLENKLKMECDKMSDLKNVTVKNFTNRNAKSPLL